MTGRCCSRCGRLTDDPIVKANDDDRGPVEIVWCRDPAACDAARAKQRLRIPRRTP